MDTHPLHVVRDTDLRLEVMAAPDAATECVGRIRDWLAESVAIDTQRTGDIVLAAYEALANCVDHAYRHRDASGEMTVEATYDVAEESVRVCVTDRGSWIEPPPPTPRSSRGRGLTLMRALTDEIDVHGTPEGTTVCLHFSGCPTTGCPTTAVRGSAEAPGVAEVDTDAMTA